MRKISLAVTRAIGQLRYPPDGQIATLDLLRTCAILLVVICHVTSAYLADGGKENVFSSLPFVKNGWIGVDLFFVLSGYFIGRQLWRELDKTGTIKFSTFMIRRSYRIWPLYFFFLLFNLIVLQSGDFPFGRWWSDALFITNFISQGVVMGSWSLCTEEQFYIVTPLLLILFSSRIKDIRSCRKWLWLLFLLLPLIRMTVWWCLKHSLEPGDPDIFRSLYYPSYTHCDGLIIGLIIANVSVSGDDRGSVSKWNPYFCIPLSLVLMLVGWKIHKEIFNFTTISLVWGAIVFAVVQKLSYDTSNNNRRASLFYILSRLSYGMYLNHEYLQEPCVSMVRRLIPFLRDMPILNNVVACCLCIGISTCISFVTFALIEAPFLQIRDAALAKHRIGKRTPVEFATG